MKLLVISLVLMASLFSDRTIAQSKNEKEILQVLDHQVAAWNRGNIDEFMVGYWNNDSLMFIGKNGITYGYTNTLNNYKKRYSDTAQMGQLKFDILQVKKMAVDVYYVVGKWFLKRSVGDMGGHYTLLFRKIGGKWVIVSDHSS